MNLRAAVVERLRGGTQPAGSDVARGCRIDWSMPALRPVSASARVLHTNRRNYVVADGKIIAAPAGDARSV